MGRKSSLRLSRPHCAQTTELLLLQDSCQDSWKWQIKTRYCLVDEKVVKSKDFQHKFKVDPEGSKSQTRPRSRSRSNSSSSSSSTSSRSSSSTEDSRLKSSESEASHPRAVETPTAIPTPAAAVEPEDVAALAPVPVCGPAVPESLVDVDDQVTQRSSYKSCLKQLNYVLQILKRGRSGNDTSIDSEEGQR